MGLIALIAAFIAFMVALAVPLFVQTWRSLAIVVVVAAVFFAFVNYDLPHPDGITQFFGPFLFGLSLFGFAAGVIAKFVMLVGRR
ncbi:MAG: hypothetical protein JWQ89_4196 [Devosia sp.]|uniref:hypothetical protein n=1 Tax=Devosia sp. TaxID=1871048 RepID=UPI002612882D|nr:hypothetical protein [Devosia sp.]MDB5542469.1 hypothetical protein [Devosia sp.]